MTIYDESGTKIGAVKKPKEECEHKLDADGTCLNCGKQWDECAPSKPMIEPLDMYRDDKYVPVKNSVIVHKINEIITLLNSEKK
jgi:hypothetical protein